MKHMVRLGLPAVLILATSVAAQAQTAPAAGERWAPRYFKDHGVSMSVGATGNFEKQLTSNATPVTFNSPTFGPTVFTNQAQSITSSFGFLYSFQFHPVSWAGIEMNYGYQHYTEEFTYRSQAPNVSFATTGDTRVPTTTHEATAAYQFHPKHIPFGPFVNVGGGAIDFVPTRGGTNQWRGVGLLETGFETNLPYTQKRLALRVQGRGLFYRSPNFNNPYLSTRSWRVSAEPSAGIVYRF